MRTRLGAVVRKEFREIRRDRLTLWIVVAVPIVLLFVFGYALSLDVDDVPIAVLDLDRSPESAALVDAFANTGDFVVRHKSEQESDVARLLDTGRIGLALVVPRGFGEQLATGRFAVVQTLIDGSFSARATVVRDKAQAVILAYNRKTVAHALGEVPGGGPRVEPRVWFNASLRSSAFIVPGLFAVILMAFPPLLTTLAIVREKESGSIQQIYVSPLKPWEFIGGKMLAYVLIALIEFLLIVSIGTLWFRLLLQGSLGLLLLGGAVYILCTVGIGLLVSTLTRSQVVAMLLATIITVMPSFLFSGFLYPISSMTASARFRTYLFPTRYFTEISRGLFMKGVGLGVLWDELAILVGYTALVFTAAALRFHKKLA